jgi:hypothetical protein
MTKRKKQAIILLTLSVPMLWFGLTNFMSDTTSSNALGMMIAISITFGGLFGISGLVMLATKNSLGIWDIDDKEKEIINQPTKKVKPMAKTKTDTSVELMKREKELETRRKELESLLAEVSKEEKAVEKQLLEKGWVQQKDGTWGVR